MDSPFRNTLCFESRRPDLPIAFHHVIEPMLPVHCHQRHPVIVQKKESAVTVHHLFDLWSFPLFQDRPETIANIALALMAVQTQTTEVLDSFPTIPVTQEADQILQELENPEP